MIQTLAFNARLPVLLGASPYYQTPNAPIARGLALTEEDYVKARLTAIAIETEEFSRDDIYTLFVTTRILNFLKGLPLASAADLTDLLGGVWSDERTRIGFELLKNLVETGRLRFWTQQGFIENIRFKPELLARVLSVFGELMCQNGRSIALRKAALLFAHQSHAVPARSETTNAAPWSAFARTMSPP
jgi:hypothetical protein